MQRAGSVPRAGRLPALAKYEVMEELGHGGMATVYRARDRRLGRDVAVKVIHPHLRDSPEVAHRFFVEAKAVAKLRHPNIVEVFDVSEESEPEQYLVVELLRGLTLRKLLQDHGAIPPEVAAALAIELLHALAHAHTAGVVHRDVKPENVMIEHRPRDPDPARANGGGERPGERVLIKLTDFGIAKLLDAQGVTSTGQVLGSPAHMAPEQIEGGAVDPRADVFGLGVLLYECMVGHLPFEGNNPAQVLRRVLDGTYPSAERERPTVGKRWSMLLDRALARLPEDRFESALAMCEALSDELRRLGIDEPRNELEAWADDPRAYADAHDARLITRLCALGAEERKAGDVLGAAADYNRALAYAPHDPQLLRIVSRMHRSESRKKLVLHAARVGAGAIALGVAAFFVTRAVRPRPVRPPAVEGATVAELPAEIAPLPKAPSAPEPPEPRPRVAPAAAPVPTLRPAPKPVERFVVLDAVRPPFGVLVAVDDKPLGSATEGRRIALDERAHTLKFTCVNDACEPVTKAIDPGDAPETPLSVTLGVKPATLVVEGDPSSTYGIEEIPSVTVRAGVPTSVPVPRGNFVIHVVERPSGRRVSATLDPGRERHAAFDAADE